MKYYLCKLVLRDEGTPDECVAPKPMLHLGTGGEGSRVKLKADARTDKRLKEGWCIAWVDMKTRAEQQAVDRDPDCILLGDRNGIESGALDKVEEKTGERGALAVEDIGIEEIVMRLDRTFSSRRTFS